MIVYREASQPGHRPSGRDREREDVRVAREWNVPRTKEDRGREDAAEDPARRGEAVPNPEKLENAALPQFLRMVEEQVDKVPADDAGDHRPDGEIP